MHADWQLILEGNAQTADDDCFVGGRPKLPPAHRLPTCNMCGALQTFFFQIAFPDAHMWTGFTLAVFACTSCARERYRIPEMLRCPLPGADISSQFLTRYQRNFRFEVFETQRGRGVSDYEERIRFRQVRLSESHNATSIGHVGGTPVWLLEDESPQSVDSKIPMRFLLQIEPGVRFETVADAPPQMEVGLTGAPTPSPYDYYELFLGNAIYLFGTDDRSLHLVYALTQID